MTAVYAHIVFLRLALEELNRTKHTSWDFRFSCWWKCGLWSSGLWHNVALYVVTNIQRSSKMFVTSYKTRQHHSAEDNNPQSTLSFMQTLEYKLTTQLGHITSLNSANAGTWRMSLIIKMQFLSQRGGYFIQAQIQHVINIKLQKRSCLKEQ
jgi:hypothetical protein